MWPSGMWGVNRGAHEITYSFYKNIRLFNDWQVPAAGNAYPVPRGSCGIVFGMSLLQSVPCECLPA